MAVPDSESDIERRTSMSSFSSIRSKVSTMMIMLSTDTPSSMNETSGVTGEMGTPKSAVSPKPEDIDRAEQSAHESESMMRTLEPPPDEATYPTAPSSPIASCCVCGVSAHEMRESETDT